MAERSFFGNQPCNDMGPRKIALFVLLVLATSAMFGDFSAAMEDGFSGRRSQRRSPSPGRRERERKTQQTFFKKRRDGAPPRAGSRPGSPSRKSHGAGQLTGNGSSFCDQDPRLCARRSGSPPPTGLMPGSTQYRTAAPYSPDGSGEEHVVLDLDLPKVEGAEVLKPVNLVGAITGTPFTYVACGLVDSESISSRCTDAWRRWSSASIRLTIQTGREERMLEIYRALQSDPALQKPARVFKSCMDPGPLDTSVSGNECLGGVDAIVDPEEAARRSSRYFVMEEAMLKVSVGGKAAVECFSPQRQLFQLPRGTYQKSRESVAEGIFGGEPWLMLCPTGLCLVEPGNLANFLERPADERFASRLPSPDSPLVVAPSQDSFTIRCGGNDMKLDRTRGMTLWSENAGLSVALPFNPFPPLPSVRQIVLHVCDTPEEAAAIKRKVSVTGKIFIKSCTLDTLEDCTSLSGYGDNVLSGKNFAVYIVAPEEKVMGQLTQAYVQGKKVPSLSSYSEALKYIKVLKKTDFKGTHPHSKLNKTQDPSRSPAVWNSLTRRSAGLLIVDKKFCPRVIITYLPEYYTLVENAPLYGQNYAQQNPEDRKGLLNVNPEGLVRLTWDLEKLTIEELFPPPGVKTRRSSQRLGDDVANPSVEKFPPARALASKVAIQHIQAETFYLVNTHRQKWGEQKGRMPQNLLGSEVWCGEEKMPLDNAVEVTFQHVRVDMKVNNNALPPLPVEYPPTDE